MRKNSSLVTLLIALASGPASMAENATALSITSEPARASVFLDGRFLGTTPLKVASVSEGNHFLKLTRHRHRNWSRVVAVAGKVLDLHAKLVSLPSGEFRLESIPANADAFVAGEFRGRTPLVVGGLPTGKVPVRIEKTEYLTWQGEAEVPTGKPGALSVTLKSKIESFLLDEIQRHPGAVNNYSELGHYYITRLDIDRALVAYAKGMDACVGPEAIPNDCMRLYNELAQVYGGNVFKIGDKATMEKLQARVLKLYEEGIKRTPDNERNYWALSAYKQKKAEWDECVRLAEQALAHSRTERIRNRNIRLAALVTYHRAHALQGQKKLAEAAAAYEASARKYAPAHYAMTSLASAISLCDSALKKPEKALELRRLHIKLFPHAVTSRTHQTTIARQFDAAGKYEEAIAEYEAFIRLFPESDTCPSMRLAVAAVYATKLKSPQKALEHYLACVKEYPEFDGSAGALKAASDLHEQLGAPRKARALRDRLLKKFPRSAEAAALDENPASTQKRSEAAKLYAEALANEASQLQPAIEAYERVVTDFPQTSRAVAALTRVITLHQTRTKDQAREIDTRNRQVAMFADDDRAPGWLLALAARHTALKQPEKAVAVYRKLVHDYPESDHCPVAQYTLAGIYYQTIFDQQKAVEEYRKVVENYPHHAHAPTAQYQIGWSYFLSQRGKQAEAIAAFRKLMAEYPLSSNATSAEYWLDALLNRKGL